MYNIIGKKWIFLGISGVLIVCSLIFLILFGLKPGIDFTGGTLMEVRYANSHPSNQEIQDKLKSLNLGEVTIQPVDNNSVVLRFKEIDQVVHQQVLAALGQVEETRFESIGPIVGGELLSKARWAIVLAILAILLYIAWSFRRLSKIFKGSETWRYATGAILSLVHDVIIILGLFALLGKLANVEINTTFIIAILTVLGYSVSDTIVVYDRIRENFLMSPSTKFVDNVNRSLNETIARSLTTSSSTLLALFVILFFGGESIRYFIVAMIVGIATGAWSSIAIATPFLLWRRAKAKA